LATFGIISAARLHAAISAAITRDPEVAELAVWVHRDLRREGIATEALNIVLPWCFSSGIARVWIGIDPENEPSHALARSMGFVREGVLRAHCRDRRTNKRHDCVVYSLLPTEPERRIESLARRLCLPRERGLRDGVKGFNPAGMREPDEGGTERP